MYMIILVFAAIDIGLRECRYMLPPGVQSRIRWCDVLCNTSMQFVY